MFQLYDNLHISFVLDGLSLIFTLTISSVWVMISLFILFYKNKREKSNQILSSLIMSGSIGTALSGDFLTLYLLFTLTTLLSFILLNNRQNTIDNQTTNAFSFYQFFLFKGLILISMVLIYINSGTLDFQLSDIYKGVIEINSNKTIFILVYFFTLFGFTHTFLFPFHNKIIYKSDSHETDFLFCGTIFHLGIFSFIRIMLSQFGINNLELLNLYPR